ncbi:uncharacterized protein J3R85_015094 [Psidium guajava]|nr:uncharacterized protein J3R85_015094 [Psidium guajava]
MSITHCLLLFIITGLSLHICDGRRLMDMDKKLVRRATSSSKSGVKTGLDLVNIASNFKFMQTNNSFNNEGNNAETPVAKKPESAIVQARTTQKSMTTRDAKGKIRGPSHHHQNISVSWRVPRKIPTGKHPELDADYCPPKTHPPSHN